MNSPSVPMLDHPLVSERYFYPWPSRFENPFFVEGNGFRLGCRWRRAENGAPTIIHFHGNGETVADYVGDFEEQVTASGAGLFLAEYRGYGMSSGEPSLSALLADVELVVKSSGVDPQHIIFFGRSLGSICAVHGAALFPGAAGLVLESGIADPLDLILMRIEPRQLGTDVAGLREVVDRELNQLGKLASFGGRSLVMHTRNDDLVPVSHAERLFECANEPKDLIIFDRGDHNNIQTVNRDAYFVAVADLIRKIKPS